MQTTCPHCHTGFRIGAAQLKVAHGRVRCGRCRAEFDALVNLVDDESPPETREQAKEQGGTPAVPPASPPAPDPVVDALPRELLTDLLPESAPRHTLAWGLLGMGLACGLAAQISWHYRMELLGDARWRARLETLCTKAGCTLPTLRDRDLLDVSGTVAESETAADALDAEIVLANRAHWPQDWPDIEVALTSADGGIVALRRLSGAEYRAINPDLPALLPARNSVTVRAGFAPPSRPASGYRFDIF